MVSFHKIRFRSFVLALVTLFLYNLLLASDPTNFWISGRRPSLEEATYGNGRYVAVSSHHGRAYWSDDGLHWRAASIPDGYYYGGNLMHLYSVGFSNNSFIAVGERNLTLRSLDGKRWTRVTEVDQLSDDLYDIESGDGKFIAVGSRRKATKSTDGISWTEFTVIAPEDDSPISSLEKIAYGNGKWIVVDSDTYTFVSEDLENWSRYHRGPAINAIDDLIFHDTFFIAVSRGDVFTSDDGEIWSQVGNCPETVTKIAASSDGFIASGESGAIWKSSNFVDWTVISTVGEGAIIAREGEDLAVVSTDMAAVEDSSSGDWEAKRTDSGNSLNALCWHRDSLIAGGHEIIGKYHLDTHNLETGSSPFGENEILEIVSNGSQCLARAYYGGVLAKSENGIEWLPVDLDGFQGLRIYEFQGKFLVNAWNPDTGDKCLFESTDLITWSDITPSVDQLPISFQYNSNDFLSYEAATDGSKIIFITGAGGALGALHSDGTWTEVEYEFAHSISSIAYLNGRWVAAGRSGLYRGLHVSEDGFSWHPLAPDNTGELTYVARALDYFLAGDESNFYRSTDGISWELEVLGTEVGSPSLSDFAFGHGITVRAHDQIFQSAPYVAPAQPPANIEASDGAFEDRIHLTWNSSAGALSYSIYRGETLDRDQATKVEANISDMQWVDYSVIPGNYYHYWVVANNQAGEGNFGEGDSGYAVSIASPPSSITCSKGTNVDHISVSWTPGTRAEKYRFYRSENSNGPFGLVSSHTSDIRNVIDENVTAGVRYWYRVSSWTATGGESPPTVAEDGFLALLSPHSLIASEGTLQNEIHLTWKSDYETGTFEVFRGLESDGTGSQLIGTTHLKEFTDETITPRTRYFYFIRAINGDFSSSLSIGDDGVATLNAPFRPDCVIGPLGRTAQGNNDYRRPPAQTSSQKSRKSKRVLWRIDIQNDGETEDFLRTNPLPQDRYFKFRFFDSQGGNRTAHLLTGRLVFQLSPAQSEPCILSLKPSRRLISRRKRKTKGLSITTVSSSAPQISDTVTARIKWRSK